MNQSVISSPIVRRRRSSAEVAALLSTFERSGQSMSDFCRQRQMSVSSFSSLHRRYAGKHSSAKASPAAALDAPSAAVFLPVKIVEGRPVAAVVTKSSLLYVEIPGGIRIAVERDFDDLTLRRLVAALGKE
jgi:hypothetical protein